MRHQLAGFKLGRNGSHRKSMWRNMSVALFTHGQITTTIPKAKSLKPFVEKMITLARGGSLAERRRAISMLGGNPFLVDRDLKDSTRKELAADGYVVDKYHELQDGPRVIERLFSEIGPRFKEREGGYTRIIRLGKYRLGDAAQLCVLQLVGNEEDDASMVSGQHSRRREKADRRMTFASERRKAIAERGKPAEAAVAASEAVAEAPAVDAPASEEAAGDAEKN